MSTSPDAHPINPSRMRTVATCPSPADAVADELAARRDYCQGQVDTITKRLADAVADIARLETDMERWRRAARAWDDAWVAYSETLSTSP